LTSWVIADATITRIAEQLGPAGRPSDQYIAGFDREILAPHMDWLLPHHYSPEQDRLITSIHSWLIRTRHHTILLDCCGGNHKNRPGFPRFHQQKYPYLERLRDAGVAPEDIDIVLCTHLHSDHVGWNTMLKDGHWVPTFPRAKYIFSRLEHDLGDPRSNPAAEADLQRSFSYRDSVLPIIESGQAVIVDGAHALDDSLTIVSAPGHTRGHIAMWLSNTTERALFAGDVLHHPLQIYAPHWNSAFCELPDVARATRLLLLEQCVEHRAKLFPAHFGFPHVAQVLQVGEGFAHKFVEADCF
jgi:glyoxylase-like metal-dependent hydrolase (beta-lactamase superfamily II)